MTKTATHVTKQGRYIERTIKMQLSTPYFKMDSFKWTNLNIYKFDYRVLKEDRSCCVRQAIMHKRMEKGDKEGTKLVLWLKG